MPPQQKNCNKKLIEQTTVEKTRSEFRQASPGDENSKIIHHSKVLLSMQSAFCAFSLRWMRTGYWVAEMANLNCWHVSTHNRKIKIWLERPKGRSRTFFRRRAKDRKIAFVAILHGIKAAKYECWSTAKSLGWDPLRLPFPFGSANETCFNLLLCTLSQSVNQWTTLLYVAIFIGHELRLPGL